MYCVSIYNKEKKKKKKKKYCTYKDRLNQKSDINNRRCPAGKPDDFHISTAKQP